MRDRKILGLIIAAFVITGFIHAQEKEFISYKVDGKEFHFTEVKLEFHPDHAYLAIEAGKTEKIDRGPDFFPRYRDYTIAITIELAYEEASLVGKHESKIPDTMPVYIEWYEWIDKKEGEIATPYISLDGGNEDVRIFTVIFENIGPPGSIIKGSFYGKLYDQDDKLHEVTEGKFAIKRTDVTENFGLSKIPHLK